jgi:NAD(P)-dependent dehydrogenase (short-subunit alcohol dehydrogenase family)
MKTVLITGVNGGIGQALAIHFNSQGWHVIGTDIQPTSTCDSIHEFIPCDLAIGVDAIGNYLDKQPDRPLHCLINNAAIQITGKFAEISTADLLISLQVNVVAAFSLSKLLFNCLTAARGTIINISSIHATLTKPGFLAYSVSKAALSGLTRAMALDIGDKIRVNAIEPAAVATDMLIQGFGENIDGLNQLNEFHPTGKLGTPEEIARLAHLIASEQLPFLNGSCISIDGGIRCRLHDPA